MIKIRIENAVIGFHSHKKTLNCPQCGKEDFFYSVSPRRCSDCGFGLVNVFDLIDNRKVREEYYKKGEM
jgi:ribosomal protein L37E